MNKSFKVMLVLLIASLLTACNTQDKTAQKDTHVYVAKQEPLSQTLHFSGTVQPLQENTLISPIDAVVSSMNFHYGQWVKKGDVVFTLNSTELQKQFNDNLTEYLKAKDSYTIAKAKFAGTQDLWEAGLISKNNYLSEKSSLDTTRVSLMQTKRKLAEMLEKVGQGNQENLANLNLSDFNKVSKALTAKHDVILIKSETDGILLYPPKSTDDKSARITTGSAIKSGQALGLIGDLRGISLEIDVPEVDIDKLFIGMPAKIQGVAFGGQVLQGKVVAINAQAAATSNSGLPVFNAVVVVPQLTSKQKPWIKVGMSASIELSLQDSRKLMIPIQALYHEKGNTLVKVKTQKGKIEERVITTGQAQADKVIVNSGLMEGEWVWLG